MEEKVVKCRSKQCGLFFGYSEVDTTCPFCHTPYRAEEAKIAEKPKEKKVRVRSQKESFKMWSS